MAERTMADDKRAGRVYATAPGRPVAQDFATGFWARHADTDPLAIGAIELFVNNPRMARLTEEALADRAPGSALLPQIRAVADLGADPLSCPELAPPLPPLRRRLHLIRLVEAYLAAEGADAAPVAAAPDLAAALEGLLDECDTAGLDPAALDGADGGAHAVHWQRTLAFADIVRRSWPEIRAEAEGGALDPRARQRLAVELTIAGWRAAPPAQAVMAVGSTGSVASTAMLLAAVAALPGGTVVLPGLDRSIAPDVWAEIAAGDAPEHPQAPFAGVLARLDLAPWQVAPWTGVAAEAQAPAARGRLISLALTPAPATERWQAEAPELAPDLETALAHMAVIEAETPREEAAAIALAIREALEIPGRRIALISPDAALARRVTAELGRFAILPDDSLGQPLAQSPPGVFLRLILRAASRAGDLAALAGLLHHPLMRPGMARGPHLELLRLYDRRVLRRPAPDLAPGRLPPWRGPQRTPGTTEDPLPAEQAVAHWLAAIEGALAPLAGALVAGAPLETLVRAHRYAAEALSRAAPGARPEVWRTPAGEAALGAVDALAVAADAHGPGPVPGYGQIVTQVLSEQPLRPDPAAPHPRVALLGPREARGAEIDFAILAGLNDGVWPALPDPDPWLSRPMRDHLGLPRPEVLIGLSAHDFVEAAQRPRVLMTRARRVDGSPAVASRWLIRLQNLLGGIGDGDGWARLCAPGKRLRELVRRPEVHATALTAAEGRAGRPSVAVPPEARPRALSVTEIETLVRDAYAIYARRVLGLEPLDPLGRPPDPRDRGRAFHTVLERFVAETETGIDDPEQARERLIEIAGRVLADQVARPDVRRLWQARLARAAGWFVGREAGRRGPGGSDVLALERRGRLEIAAPAGPFVLSARADRIDRLPDGTAAIYDYKTGAPPTPAQIDSGLALQLHLQAAILAAGGFDGVAAIDASTGAYIGLTGSAADRGGKEVVRPGLAAETRSHLEKFGQLIAHYDDPASRYVSRGMVERVEDIGDYDHLARRAEWDGEDGDDA